MDVQAHLVGRVKGRGGSTIRALQDISRGVKIDFETLDNDMARVHVRGMDFRMVTDVHASITDLCLGSGQVSETRDGIRMGRAISFFFMSNSTCLYMY